MIKFMHIRYKDKDGHIKGKGGVTIAYEVAGENIGYAIARCNEKDNFCKAQGRVKSAGRMQSLKHIHFFRGTKEEFYAAMQDTPIQYVGNMQTP